MDVDRRIAERRPGWRRLDDLLGLARARRRRTLVGADARELVRRYRAAASDLSWLRTKAPNSEFLPYLTRLVTEGSSLVQAPGTGMRAGLTTFFSWTFPAAVWSRRWAMLASAVLFFAPALVVGVWMANSDAAVDALGEPALVEAYIEEDFEAYYSSSPAQQFATEVTVNNIRVSLLAFAGGIAFGIVTAYVLVTNGAFVGQAAGLFHHEDQATKFWGLVTPHGLLEISAVVIAGGAGLALAWALVSPGDRTRGRAVADEGRRSVSIVLGLTLAFIAAGIIEAFVTPSSLPPWTRVMVGAVVWFAFVTYIVVRGRAAEALGLDGSLGERPLRADLIGRDQSLPLDFATR